MRGSTIRRTAGTALALALTLGSVTACGDPEDAYCDQLRQDRQSLARMIDSSSPGALLGNVEVLRGLAAKAPDDLTDEWQTFLNAVEGLADAVRRAGLRPSEVRGGLPTSLSAAQRSAVTGAADVLASTAVVQAAQGIETQGRDVCKVDIGL